LPIISICPGAAGSPTGDAPGVRPACAWLLTLFLRRRPERIGAALGLAAAPDFIDSTIATLDAAQKTALERCG
jgi:hypothetical protein